MRDIREKNWFWIENDLVDREDLKPMERLLYIILARYSDNKSGESFPSEETLCAKSGVKDKRTIRIYIESLEKKGLIDVKRQLGKSNRYFLKSIKLVTKNETSKLTKESVAKNDTGNKFCEKEVANFVETSSKICHSNYTNKNTLIKTTTTKLNYIYPMKNKIPQSSNDSILKLKKYLIDYIQDIPTCKNIMFLVENKGITLERVKKVIEYAKKQNKSKGYIYKALEENWELPKENLTNNVISSLEKEKEFIEKRKLERQEVERQKLPQIELTVELENQLIQKIIAVEGISKSFLINVKAKNRFMYENMLKKYL